MKKVSNKALIRFLVSALIFYVIWYVTYTLWIHPWKKLDLGIIDNLVFLSSKILTFFNYKLIDFPNNEGIRTIGIDGSHGLWVGDPCNGLTLFALYSGFIIAYPGRVKWKLIFIPTGLITIHFLNVFRIVGLALITYYCPQYLDFNHTYTFTITIYTCIFLFWYYFAANQNFRKKI